MRTCDNGWLTRKYEGIRGKKELPNQVTINLDKNSLTRVIDSVELSLDETAEFSKLYLEV